MGKVTAHMSISLDGFIAGPNDSVENPLGDDGIRLHDWMIGLMIWRENHGLEGGITSRDDEIVEDVTRDNGAIVMGRRMFHNDGGPWTEPLWPGFWGDNPPFHLPVFVVTHHPRPSLE
ncbi:MAG TPA: dihydrofolate reductase family protein, partial [Thermomicrobiales bacterium]|nr:dihydrofolate reductase family protein [Thermomicrobiales bacterium]